MKLDGKVAIVVGGGVGVGAFVSRKLAQEGARLIVTEHESKRLEGVKQEISGAEFVVLDAANEADVIKFVGEVVAKHGKIDVLVNASRVAIKKLILETPIEEFKRIFDFSVKSVFLTSKEVAKQMKAQGNGSIINLASKAANSGPLLVGAYATAMNGISGFTRSFALDMRTHGIKVNVVCPGRIDNEEFQLGAEMLGAEAAEPKSYLNFSALFDVTKEREAVANMVAYLASDEGGFIHAQSYSLYDDETTSIRNLATTNWEE